MVKSHFFLFFTFLLVACGKSGGGSGSNQEMTSLEASQVSSSTPVPEQALKFDTNVDLLDFNTSQSNKVDDAAELIRQVVASKEFKAGVLNHKYKGKKTFVDNGGLTNAQIYVKILEASESLRPGKNYTMDITIETYYTSANVIGYTLPSANQIWVNTKYLNNFTPSQVASNMFHEWLHKLGFKHSSTANAARPYSVPYAVGYLVKKLAVKFS